jgi:hypothetical protein
MCCIIKYTTFLALLFEINIIFERTNDSFHRLTLNFRFPFFGKKIVLRANFCLAEKKNKKKTTENKSINS